jgi:prevent-host-death family protein
MQKTLSELASLPDGELLHIVEKEPLLVTKNGEPHFVAQSLDSFESMVRRLRQLEALLRRPAPDQRGKVMLLRPYALRDPS